MKKPDWYVIQVETGRERVACETILRTCEHMRASSQEGESTLRECFAPRYVTQVKLRGEFVDEERLLLPGYVIAVTERPWGLARILRATPGFMRILTMGKTFAPLSDDDRSWIERWTQEGDRTIPMSIAYKIGDTVVVTEGPLKGNEGMITRIRRRKSLAELEIHAGQLTIHTTVGLAVLPEPTG